MLAVTVTNKLETQQVTHKSGPLEIGRGPGRDGAARVVVRDAFVSRDHVRLEALPGGKVRVTNLSSKAPLTIDNHSILGPGTDAEFILPVRLGMGETVMDVSESDSEPLSAHLLRTVAAPVRGDATKTHPALIDRSDKASPEEIVGWLETVVSVQRAADPQDFYDRTAKALVERIGLDSGMVLERDGDAWRVAAMIVKDESAPGRAFSHAILAQVLQAKRTFYMPAGASGGSDSLVGVQGVVASPIIDAKDEVIGVVYGTRIQRAAGESSGRSKRRWCSCSRSPSARASRGCSRTPRHIACASRRSLQRKPTARRATSSRWSATSCALRSPPSSAIPRCCSNRRKRISSKTTLRT